MNLHCIIFVLISYITSAFSQDGTCEHTCLGSTCTVSKLSNLCYYRFSDTIRTWDETKTFCKENGLSLVNLAKEIDRIGFTKQSIFSDFPPDEYVWLGGSAQDLPDWTYVNGVLLDGKYAIGNPGSEEGQANYLCGTVSQTSDDVTVERADCGAEYHFICRYDDWEGTPSYYISERKATWFNAKSRCIDLGGNLFYLNQNENLNFLKEKLSTNDKFFVGAIRRNWKWDDGRVIDHFYWNKGEPNTYTEKCIAMYPETGAWFDMGCSLPMHTICQGAETPEPVSPAPTSIDLECSDTSGLIAGVVILTIALLIALMYPTYEVIWKKKLKPRIRQSNTEKHTEIEVDPQPQKEPLLTVVNDKPHEPSAVEKPEGCGINLRISGWKVLKKDKDAQTNTVELSAKFNERGVQLQFSVNEIDQKCIPHFVHRICNFDMTQSEFVISEHYIPMSGDKNMQ